MSANRKQAEAGVKARAVRGVWGALLGMLAAVVLGGRVEAATACGTIITNVVTVTMWSGCCDFVSYEVSYNATATLEVYCPVVSIQKKVDWAQASVGTTVTFSICVENTTDDSIWGVLLTDMLPVYAAGTGMRHRGRPAGWTGGSYNPAGGGLVFSYRIGAGAWTAGDAPNGTDSNPGTELYLRWEVERVGPQTSACVVYAAEIL